LIVSIILEKQLKGTQGASWESAGLTTKTLLAERGEECVGCRLKAVGTRDDLSLVVVIEISDSTFPRVSMFSKSRDTRERKTFEPLAMLSHIFSIHSASKRTSHEFSLGDDFSPRLVADVDAARAVKEAIYSNAIRIV
jgi:hypothetical protein